MTTAPRKPALVHARGKTSRDQGGRPLTEMLRETGISGTKLFSGIITDEYLPALDFYNAQKVYDQMRRSDATVAALLAAFKMPLRAAKWYIQPYDDSPESVQMADFLHDNLWSFGQQTFDDFLRELLTYLEFGFSWFEKVFDWMEGEWNGKLGWDKFAFRYQNTRYRWNFAPVSSPGGVMRQKFTSVTQFAPPFYQTVDIPAEKVIVFSRDKEGDNLDGISLLRPVYKPWLLKDALYRIQGIGLERAAVGVPYAKWLMDVSDTTLSTVTAMLENLRVDDQASIQWDGNECDIGYLANKFDAVAVASAIDHHDGQILKAGLAQFVNLGTRGVGTTGSYALSSEQAQMFLDALNGEANYLASQFHLQAAIQLLEWNFPNIDRKKLPRLAHGDIGERAVQKMSVALNAFAQYGFLSPDPRTENVIREFLDLPERDEDYHLQVATANLDATPTAQVGSLTSKKPTPAPPAAPPGVAGGTGSQVSRQIKTRPQLRAQSVGGGQTGAHSQANMSEDQLDRLRDDFFGEIQSMKRTVLDWQPERPSDRVRRTARPYTIRGHLAEPLA